jgi:hypothetical protein
MLFAELLRRSTTYPSSGAEIKQQLMLLPIVEPLLGYKADKTFLARDLKFLARIVNKTTSNFSFITCAWVQNVIRHALTQNRHVNLLDSRNESRLICDVTKKIVQYKLNLKLVDNFSQNYPVGLLDFMKIREGKRGDS